MKTTICYGSEVKLRHVLTGRYLSSFASVYTHVGTSGQQMVVGRDDTAGDVTWIVRGPSYESLRFGIAQPVRHGAVVRLTHQSTTRNLHSHNDRPAPISRTDREVTAYGSNAAGDEKDDWIVEVEGGGDWTTEQIFKLRHQATGLYLHSHLKSDSKLTLGKQEVTAANWKDQNDNWIVPGDDLVLRSAAKTESKWKGPLEYLNIAGSLASITGWTLLSLRETINSFGWQEWVGTFVSALITVALAFGIIHLVISRYLDYRSNPSIKYRSLAISAGLAAVTIFATALYIVALSRLIHLFGAALRLIN